MFVSPNPLSRQVTIPWVDLAYFMDDSNDAKSLAYRHSCLLDRDSSRSLSEPPIAANLFLRQPKPLLLERKHSLLCCAR
jgi:hypothetical protein